MFVLGSWIEIRTRYKLAGLPIARTDPIILTLRTFSVLLFLRYHTSVAYRHYIPRFYTQVAVTIILLQYFPNLYKGLLAISHQQFAIYEYRINHPSGLSALCKLQGFGHHETYQNPVITEYYDTCPVLLLIVMSQLPIFNSKCTIRDLKESKGS